MIPRETLEKMFKDAENLLNVRNSITTAASNDNRIWTVKNMNSSYPQIVASNKKKRNIVESKWKSYMWYSLWPHTVAITCDTGISFDFFSENQNEIKFERKEKSFWQNL